MVKIRASNEWEDREAAVKKRLRSYRVLVLKYNACRDLLDSLQLNVTSKASGDKVMCSGNNSAEDKIVTRLDLERQMEKSLQDMRDEIAQIMNLISLLDGDEFIVVLRRYTLNESMEITSKFIGKSIVHCWRIHGRAISKISLTELGNDME
jgi:hypothetical protein